MANALKLEQLAGLVEELPPGDQLRLVARISERLTRVVTSGFMASPGKGTRSRKDSEQRAGAIIRACDRAAMAFTRKTDSAETIRELRDERLRQICQSK